MIRAALTVEEALEGMKSLEPKIKNYARLVVRKGVNVKPGQEAVSYTHLDVYKRQNLQKTDTLEAEEPFRKGKRAAPPCRTSAIPSPWRRSAVCRAS